MATARLNTKVTHTEILSVIAASDKIKSLAQRKINALCHSISGLQVGSKTYCSTLDATITITHMDIAPMSDDSIYIDISGHTANGLYLTITRLYNTATDEV